MPLFVISSDLIFLDELSVEIIKFWQDNGSPKIVAKPTLFKKK